MTVVQQPATPIELLTESPNPARDAYLFSLFYLLTPTHIESVREIFAARAYMATRQLSSAAPEYRVLRGRALMMLGYRRAAINALGSPGNDQEQELSAVLNSDLPEARSQADKASNPLKRLIEQLDVNRIKADFGIQTSEDVAESVKSLGLPGRIWPYLVARAMIDWDQWAQFDNATLSYHDSRAYRDFLSILQARKRSEEAWSGFGTLVRQQHDFAIWQSALVGHHMGGSSEAQVTQWVEQPELQRADNRVSYATSYLVLFATTDRIPSQELAAVITGIDRATWQFEDGPLSVVRPDADDPEQHILGPPGIINSHGVLPIGAFSDPKKHRVRPALSYFVEGYRAVKLHDFPGARKIFVEASALYDMASIQSSYMLPYLALASAKEGSDVSDVTAILARFPPNEPGFDYQLTSAVLAGIRGQTGESLASLKLARYRRPRNDDERPTLPQYTYGDICEILYDLTKDSKFRDEALDWARSRERAEPWHSWSYAIDAALALFLVGPQPVTCPAASASFEHETLTCG